MPEMPTDNGHSDIIRWQHGDVRPGDDIDLALATAVACYTLDLALAGESVRWGHLSDGSALAVTKYLIERLRSLPVEQRMEAMGMERVVYGFGLGINDEVLYREPGSGRRD